MIVWGYSVGFWWFFGKDSDIYMRMFVVCVVVCYLWNSFKNHVIINIGKKFMNFLSSGYNTHHSLFYLNQQPSNMMPLYP